MANVRTKFLPLDRTEIRHRDVRRAERRDRLAIKQIAAERIPRQLLRRLNAQQISHKPAAPLHPPADTQTIAETPP